MSKQNTSTATNHLSESRVLREGYGPGAWHGADMKAALGDVTAATAYWRPAAGRHNIAEIAVHHAYIVRGVRARVSGHEPKPFVLEGDDWFSLDSDRAMSWKRVQTIVAQEHDRLADLIEAIDTGAATSALPDAERAELVLGITSHAVYHAGQIQLIKRLQEA
ncbi:DinB superfamily protein [Luteitalea pratensis]|uniref:DinB superfamily protein n=1 Tax=Luteitalea pratensis TaxID=1855912 RepID=A0A143PM29_LUTPR|nr:DinB family protein [Luteitalea pratensis]AMY09138.1 DinB superfamily protein [Luteitalea pratensis]